MHANDKTRLRQTSRSAWPPSAHPPANLCVNAMGLAFANPLGLAAGVDRTGEMIPQLCSHGFGHVEIGTITRETWNAGAFARSKSRTVVGVNIGSRQPGLDPRVIEDFTAMLRQVFAVADYIVANLGSSDLHRDGDTPGVEKLVKRLSAERDVLSAVSGRRVPLLLKLRAGGRGTNFPAAIMAARVSGFDGIVLVSDCLERIRAISAYLDGLAVISVGNVASADDVRARIAAGADLVQVHGVYATEGSSRIRRILRDLAGPARRHA